MWANAAARTLHATDSISNRALPRRVQDCIMQSAWMLDTQNETPVPGHRIPLVAKPPFGVGGGQPHDNSNYLYV